MVSVVEKYLLKCHFRDSKFQNVPRCLGPQDLELVPLVRVLKPPTIHYQPATLKRFDSPEFFIMEHKFHKVS